MTYESIAKLVHDLVKNPKDLSLLEHRLPSTELNISELAIVQSVFSKYEVSGDTLAIEVIPQGMWA